MGFLKMRLFHYINGVKIYIKSMMKFTADELLEMIRLSDTVESDGLRYERRLSAEEETNEM